MFFCSICNRRTKSRKAYDDLIGY
ncbi:MAG: hypothetical protein ABTA16_01905 [Niallia sp.]|nr:hypothetical protein [Yersinia enterocolitica]